jgi:predicted RNase H-like HicB family nuclease
MAAGFHFSPPLRPRPAFVPFLRTNLISTLLSNACATRINVPIVGFPRSRLLPFALSYAEYVCYLHTAIPSATINLMTTRDFKVFLEPDEDYGGYVVVCPSIPGCYSQGKTVPEALANIREAIDLCIEDMESRGEEIPDPNNVLIGSVVVTR